MDMLMYNYNTVNNTYTCKHMSHARALAYLDKLPHIIWNSNPTFTRLRNGSLVPNDDGFGYDKREGIKTTLSKHCEYMVKMDKCIVIDGKTAVNDDDTDLYIFQ